MAHRIDTSTAQKDKFGVGKNGFTRGNPQTGVPATELDDDYFDMLQEEIVGIVEAAGDTLDKTQRNQLNTALGKLFQNKTAATSALGALVPAANRLPYFTSANGASLTELTPVGRDILASATKTAALEYLGLGDAAQRNGISGLLGQSGWVSIPLLYAEQKRSLIFQWSQTLIVGPNTATTSNFPIPFPSACFQIVGMNAGTPLSSATNSSPIVMDSFTPGRTSFQVQYANSGAPSMLFRYFAIGY